MKLKSKRAAAKRFKKTANGYIKAFKGGKSHLLSSKKRKRKRTLKDAIVLKSGKLYNNIRRLLPYN